jgi:DnaJ-class molecular chaperone with C-terminal Zn finger domain
MAVEYKDYYKILGVDRKASHDEISKAFKKLARKYHPDLNPGDKNAEDKFKELNEANEVLKDEEKRRLYDQLGPNWQNGQQFSGGGQGYDDFQFNFGGSDFDGSSGFSDFFESVFGGRGGSRGGFGPDPFGNFSTRQARGRDIEAELAVSLEDALKGGSRQITLQTQDGPKTLNVTIPAGVREGARLRLSGQGGSAPGGQAGDLYLRINYQPHNQFSIEGDNLVYDLALMPWQAVLGDKVRVPTLEGFVELSVPAGTGSGRRMRLKGKGLGPAGKRGDELVSISIRSPEKLTDKQRELWEALAKESAT